MTSYITGLSGNGQYFVDNNGHPKLMMVDNPWALIANGGEWTGGGAPGNYQTEMDNYLTSRSAQGFTGLYLSALGCIDIGGSYENGNTWDNVPPFTGGGHPSAGLNNAYWDRVDYLISTAETLGMTVFLNIAYTADATGNGTFDTGGALDSGALSPTDYADYGTNLANRYASSPNLVWVYGNDYYATNETQFGEIRTAIVAVDTTHIMSVHVYPESTSRYDVEAGPIGTQGTNGSGFAYSNAQFNWVYTYNVTYFGLELAYEEAAYYSIPQLPAIWGDGYFYNSGAALPTDQMTRQMAWWAVSTGAKGFNSGSNSIFPWASGSPAAVTTGNWWTTEAAILRTTIEGLPEWQNLFPDTTSALVTSGRGTHATGITTGSNYNGGTDDYVTASRTPDGKLAVIYCAKTFNITINQSEMAPGYTVKWLDPTNGTIVAGTPGSTYNSAGLGNNSAGEPDWVLILAQEGPLSSGPRLYGFRS